MTTALSPPSRMSMAMICSTDPQKAPLSMKSNMPSPARGPESGRPFVLPHGKRPRHVIERAVLWSHGDRLPVDQLSLTPHSPSNRSADLVPTTGPPFGVLPREGIDLAAWERSLVEQALRDSGGNQTKAAKLLRLSRDTLRYRLKKFGLSRP